MEIGSKLKELRIKNGLTQEELADRAELTKGFISQVERDLTSPSIATLVDILQCLGTDLKHFFGDDEDTQVVFTKEDFFVKEEVDMKHVITWIVPNAQKNSMEPIIVDIEPMGETYKENPHEGEEFGYVLSGTVSIVLGDRVLKAKKGEAFYYEAKYEHYLKSNKGAKVLWVCNPPTF